MSNLKLGVEVISAHDLIAKDSNGFSNPCVELHFNHQKFRTTVKEKDLNPYWNELFFFNVSNPSLLHESNLEAIIYHVNKNTRSKSAIGKVQIFGTSFVSQSDSVAVYYPLEKNHMFSRTKGELGIRAFITDDPSVRSSINPLQDDDFFQVYQSEDGNTFNHIPREQNQFNNSSSFTVDAMRATPPQRPARFFSPSSSSSSASQPFVFQLKETKPRLGNGQKQISTHDLVEKVEYLFVRVVKARDLPSKDITGSLDPYVELILGNNRVKTKHFVKNQNPEWDQVFAFPIEQLQSSILQVLVKDKDVIKDDFVGMVIFELADLPRRSPPDSPLAPEWHWISDEKGVKLKGEIMLAVWIGTQADECFPIASHSDSLIRSKVYHSPRLWYLRVVVVEAQDIITSDKTRFPEVFVRCQIGSQVQKTKVIQVRTMVSLWNEEFIFVAAEPFEESLLLSLTDRLSPNKEETIARVQIPLSSVEKRLDERVINPRWFIFDKKGGSEEEKEKKDKFLTRVQLRISLDGGYHVLDESTHYSSDLRPSAKQLWKPSLGLLELGILNADGLLPMKTREGKGTCDTYCVAKYGQKWIRTRTIMNNLSPKYNEQYTWEVYDHATVLTIAMFDNSQLEKNNEDHTKDSRIGKVRIRLSTLQTGRVYTHSYPLLILQNSGLKKMGELHLAIRFSSTSLFNTMLIYSKPILPKLHYLHPLSINQIDILRNHAVQIVASRLSRMEPPLRKEVVEYMCDVESHLWSMRRSKANFSRLVQVFSGLIAVGKWFNDVCEWKNPLTTMLVHVLFMMLVCFPELIVPTMFLYSFLIGLWNYRFRPRNPPHMNARISQAESAHPDELDEEFDTFPSSRGFEVVKMRYERLRIVAGRIQTVVGDVATQGERLKMILTWRDPRATAIFLVVCVWAAIVLYVTPFWVLVVVGGFYVMRHPRFRRKMPSLVVNFFRRLPARTDSML